MDADHEDNDEDDEVLDNDEDLEEELEEEEEEDEDYAFPIGPLPQMITNDLKSLDEMVGEKKRTFFGWMRIPLRTYLREFKA